jgi:hypothetical protein
MNNELQAIAGMGEVTRVTCAGGGSAVFAAKVKSNYSYNIYKVRVVEILAAGQTPAEIGSEMKATNLAESFTQTGQLAAGKYVLVCTTGDKNIFYAEP